MSPTKVVIPMLLATFNTAFTEPVIAAGSTPTGITLGSSANPSVFGRAVTLTATVSPLAATGFVTFYDGTTLLGTRTLTSGQAALTTSLLASGSRPIKAYYSGSLSFANITSAALTQIVGALAQSGFQQAVNYGVGSGSYDVAVGDFNNDGKADLVVPNSNDNNVSVILGNGDGTFQTAVNYRTGRTPLSVAIGDFNGDGKADLAVGNNGDGSVSVLLGNGDGTFRTAVNYPGGGPFVAIADFNGDGNADLAIAIAGGNVSVLLGKGDGTFHSALLYAVPGNPQCIAIGDFNGDGNADVAVGSAGVFSSAAGSVSVLLGNGDGTLKASVDYRAGNGPKALAVGDFNGDGRPDLAVANGGTNVDTFTNLPGSVIVLLGKGDGTFRAPVNVGSGVGGASVTVGDFNGDGRADLAVTTGGIGLLSVFLGKGDGTFQSAVNYSVGTAPWSAAVGDFNGDGRSDLAVDNMNSNNVSVLLGEAATASPAIGSAGGVVNAASLLDGVAAGTWITIFGSNLSTTTRSWAAADFNGNKLPTSLDGVGVLIDGKAAYVYFISPAQLNVLAPKDLTAGPVPVQVINANGSSSNTVTATKQLVAPAFFAYSQQDGKYVIAQDSVTYSLLGPAGLLGAGATTRPSSPGEVIVLYATGLGDTSPPYPDGQIIQTPAPLLSLPKVIIGGVTATVEFAGIVGAGLYQLNIVVPQLPSGDASVMLGLSGAQSPSGVFLPIQ